MSRKKEAIPSKGAFLQAVLQSHRLSPAGSGPDAKIQTPRAVQQSKKLVGAPFLEILAHTTKRREANLDTVAGMAVF
jgi:hypothetical protein